MLENFKMIFNILYMEKSGDFWSETNVYKIPLRKQFDVYWFPL